MRIEYQTKEESDQLESILQKGGNRTLVCFCVDISESMTLILDGQDYKIDHSRDGVARNADRQSMRAVYPKRGYTLENRISKLNDILKEMLRKMKANGQLRDSVVISLITFANEADVKNSFMYAGIDPEEYANMAVGNRANQTNADQALQLALEQIEFTRVRFNEAEVDLRMPTIVFLSDGEPTDTSAYSADTVTIGSITTKNDANSMAAVIRQKVADGELNMVPVLIGSGNAHAHSFMTSLTPERTYRKMNTARDYEEVFDLIEQAIVSRNTMVIPDESITREESVQIESKVKEEVVDTNSTGTVVLSEDDLFSVFSSGFSGDAPADDPFAFPAPAAPEDNFLL